MHSSLYSSSNVDFQSIFVIGHSNLKTTLKKKRRDGTLNKHDAVVLFTSVLLNEDKWHAKNKHIRLSLVLNKCPMLISQLIHRHRDKLRIVTSEKSFISFLICCTVDERKHTWISLSSFFSSSFYSHLLSSFSSSASSASSSSSILLTLAKNESMNECFTHFLFNIIIMTSSRALKAGNSLYAFDWLH